MLILDLTKNNLKLQILKFLKKRFLTCLKFKEIIQTFCLIIQILNYNILKNQQTNYILKSNILKVGNIIQLLICKVLW